MLKISTTAFSANLSPSGSGGAIWNSINSVTDISDSSFNLNVSGNPASSTLGGAIYSQSPNVTITRTSFTANTSAGGDGGAVAVDRGGTIIISNSTLSGNLAPLGKGGAILATNTQEGGPVSSVVALNDTIADNSGTGGIFVGPGHSVTIGNTVIVGNTCEGAVTSLGHNLSDTPSCGLTGAGDRPVDPNAALNKPAFNGGPITGLFSMKPSPGSDVIDRGDPQICSDAPVANKDQRGESRPKDGNGDGTSTCDIGAYEADAAVAGFASTPVQPGPISVGSPTAGGAAVTNTFQVYNTGQASLDINSAVLGGTDAGAFTVNGYPATIAPTDPPQNITLSCQSGTPGAKTATLTLATNDANNASVVYILVCNVSASPAAGFSAKPIQPGPIVFPTVIQGGGNNVSASITVKNLGSADLSLSAPTISTNEASDFTLTTSLSTPIAPGATKILSITCTPSAIGLRTAIFNFTTNDPSHIQVVYDLTCYGSPPPPPDLVVDFNLLQSSIPSLPASFGHTYDAAVSPDSKFAYVIDRFTNKIEVLRYGNLLGKISFWPASNVTNSNINSPTSIAVTPDGKNVFVVSSGNSSLVMFARDANSGALSNPTVWKNGQGGVTGLQSPFGIAISQDGSYVYVSTSANSSSVTIFKRASDGTFAFQSAVTHPDLANSEGLALSPDGTSLYVTASTNPATTGKLVIFRRNPQNGSLTYLHTRSQGDCDDFLFCFGGLQGMKGLFRVLVSPDGQNVYAVASLDNDVMAFTRAPDGNLTYLGQFTNANLTVPRDVAISPDGNRVYATGVNSNALVVFNRDVTSGLLTFRQAFVRGDAGPGLPALAGAWGIAPTPDGKFVVVTGYTDNSVVVFDYDNPRGTLSSLSPASALQGGANFELVVRGQDFVSGATVIWNTTSLPTTFVNSTELHATVTAAQIASAGSAPIKVNNPGPGGGDSNNSLPFTITAPAQNPVPSIDHLSPSGASAGDGQFTLDVFGANFIPSTLVYWNGAIRTTSYVDSGHLTATIPQSDIAQPGVAGVYASTGAPGGGQSNKALFTIAAPGMNPIPSITSLSPAVYLSHGGASAAETLTINGASFVDGAVVYWNGDKLQTHFISSTQLTAEVPGGELALAGTAGVSVVNPTPGGGTSNVIGLTINSGSLPPILSRLSFTGSGGQVTLTFTGKYFTPNSRVQLNGVILPSSVFISSTEMQAVVTSAELHAATFTVANLPPDYALSNPLTIKPIYLPMVKR
jgi:6-phosphogluconolactonase (cycloisomerase 2 family)